MNPKFPEKSFKRIGHDDEVKGRTPKSSLPFMIFLVIIFIVAFLFFNKMCFA